MVITPSDLPASKEKVIPQRVLDIIDREIAQTWDGTCAVLEQSHLVTLIAEAMMVSRNQVYGENWLYFEEIYRAAGWNVVYDKPGYNESYEAAFKFTIA